MKTEIVLYNYRCTGCGRCVETCRRGVLRLTDSESGRRVQVADAAGCAGCRACERSCPHAAIAIRELDGRKVSPRRLLQGVLPIVLSVGLTLPWSLNPADWSGINYWKILGLFVLFHILFAHIPYSKYLKAARGEKRARKFPGCKPA